eukprot:1156191-Pelagomonas_calceolata.AAC.10
MGGREHVGSVGMPSLTRGKDGSMRGSESMRAHNKRQGRERVRFYRHACASQEARTGACGGFVGMRAEESRLTCEA